MVAQNGAVCISMARGWWVGSWVGGVGKLGSALVLASVKSLQVWCSKTQGR